MSKDKPSGNSEVDWVTWRKRLDNFERWRERQARRKEAGEEEYELKGRLEWEIGEDFITWCEPLGNDILDLACGGGGNKLLLNDRLYIGVDPLIVEDREDFPIIQGVGETLPLKDEQFDAVLITAALDHLASLDQTFAECWRVLRDGGKLCLFTDAVDGLEEGVSMLEADETAAEEDRPLMERIRSRVEKDGVFGLAKSVYYRIYYWPRLKEFLENTHVRHIYISELRRILSDLDFDVDVIQSDKDRVFFVKAVK